MLRSEEIVVKKIATVFILALLPACVPLGAEELREGTWQGVMRIARGGNNRAWGQPPTDIAQRGGKHPANRETGLNYPSPR